MGGSGILSPSYMTDLEWLLDGISGAAAMQHSLAKITKCSILRWCSG